MRIINERLKKIFEKNNILKGNNFCGLNRDSCADPIAIINMIKEHQIEENKEYWILIQGIKKAFDSISSKSLEISLKRLKIKQNIINLLVNTFKERKIKVITKYGLSKEFSVFNGLD